MKADVIILLYFTGSAAAGDGVAAAQMEWDHSTPSPFRNFLFFC